MTAQKGIIQAKCFVFSEKEIPDPVIWIDWLRTFEKAKKGITNAPILYAGGARIFIMSGPKIEINNTIERLTIRNKCQPLIKNALVSILSSLLSFS